MKIALVTCVALPEPDHDEPLLRDALTQAGADVAMLAWDDPSADPSAFDLCVLRSSWNYHLDPDAFLGWIDRTAAVTRLVNGRDVVRWNAHKRYLRRLGDVPTVPTEWIDRHGAVDVAAVARARGWDEVVVKPAISAGSYRTRRFGAGDPEAQRFAAALAAERDVMLQPYLPGFAHERALVWIDGALTHAVIKSPRFDDQDEAVSAAQPIDDAARAIAERALAEAPGPLDYARIDVVPDGDALLVSELELIEPSLFLAQHPPALARFTAMLVR